MATETSFAALPVRQRGTLEIIDTAMKLYRRYFGVLMGWSALVAVLFVLSFSVPFGTFLVYPLIAGSGCCAIAAAVRGQSIAFGQVWDFTKPRYGALMLITFLSSLLMAVAFGIVFIVSTLISLAGVWLLSSINAPSEVTIVVGIIGAIVATIVGSILSVLAYAWLGLIPIIACLEDDKRGTAAMGRAWDLMKGSWVRVLGLATLLSIAVLAVMGIVGGSMVLYGQSIGIVFDDPSESAILGLGLTFSGFIGLFMLFWNPIQTLILAVLYLDLRVRKEALDLEWNSYASAPPQPINQPELNAVEIAADASHPELSPASMSGYAPGLSAPIEQSVRPPQPATAPDTQPPPPSQMRPPAPSTSVFAPKSEPETQPVSGQATPTNSAPIQAEITQTQVDITPIQSNIAPIQADAALSLDKETSSFSAATSAHVSPPAVPETFDFSSFNPSPSDASANSFALEIDKEKRADDTDVRGDA